MNLWRLLLSSVMVLTACSCARQRTIWDSYPVQVEVHPMTIEIEVPQEYKVWWQQMEICSKRTGSMDRWRFVMVENDQPGRGFWIEGLNLELAGYTAFNGKTFYVDQEDIFNRRVVGHEMLHALGFFHDSVDVFRRCAVDLG